MTTASPAPLALLTRAAELRAAGTPWPDAAAQLKVGHAELRRLPAEHARDYERLARRARTDFIRETLHEALAALRDQLKSSDDRIRFMAATTIVRYELARMRHGAKSAGAGLERDARRSRRPSTIGAENAPAEHVPESPKAPHPKRGNATQP